MNEVEQFIIEFNASLERFYWFRTFKFVIGLYVIIMLLASVLVLYRLIAKRYLILLLTGQSFWRVTKGEFNDEWLGVATRLESANMNEWKAAVIEAAQLVDEVIKRVDYPGNNLGERLDNLTTTQLSNLEAVKQAHKMRNMIIQDPSFQLTKDEARQAVDEFGRALKFFEAID